MGYTKYRVINGLLSHCRFWSTAAITSHALKTNTCSMADDDAAPHTDNSCAKMTNFSSVCVLSVLFLVLCCDIIIPYIQLSGLSCNNYVYV